MENQVTQRPQDEGRGGEPRVDDAVSDRVVRPGRRGEARGVDASNELPRRGRITSSKGGARGRGRVRWHMVEAAEGRREEVDQR